MKMSNDKTSKKDKSTTSEDNNKLSPAAGLGNLPSAQNQEKSRNKKSRKWIIAVIILSVFLILVLSIPIITLNIILDRIHYVSPDETPTIYDEGEISFEPDVPETPLPSGQEPTLHPYEPDPSKAPQHNEKPPADKDIVNVLLVGVEKSRPNENGRADTIIIATFDRKNKTLKLTSIMRDNYVYIPGNYLNNRINAAHAFGNMPLLLKTINVNFNLNLEKYVSVDFDGFIKVMERIGNVEIELTKKEAERLFGTGSRAGKYTLDPETALKYARLRRIDSDFMRTQRQRNLLKAIYEKGMEQDIFTLMGMLYDVLPYVKTNLTKGELISLLNDVRTMGKKEIKELRIPVDGSYKNATIRGMMVLVPDVQANAREIRKFIYGK